MSNLSECIGLYRDDIAVTDDQFEAFMLDAIDRDREAAARDRANVIHESASGEPCRCGAVDRWHSPGHPDCVPIAFAPLTQDERDQVNERTADLLADQGFIVSDGSLRDLARNVDLANLMSPEESARYLLVQFRTVQETLDLLAAADGGLIELDTRREIALGALSERIDQLEQRMDLRAEECRYIVTTYREA